MSSGFREFWSLFWKDVLTELRGKQGIFACFLYALVGITASGWAAAIGEATGTMQAALYWLTLLFTGVTGLSRTFILEEEQGTGDLLRLWASPTAVFWGKFAYNLLLTLVVAAVVTPAFMVFAKVQVGNPFILVLGILLGCVAMCSVLSVCGSLVSKAAGRALLAGVISVPILLPSVILSINAVRVGFGDFSAQGYASAIGLFGISAAYLAVGPLAVAVVWKR